MFGKQPSNNQCNRESSYYVYIVRLYHMSYLKCTLVSITDIFIHKKRNKKSGHVARCKNCSHVCNCQREKLVLRYTRTNDCQHWCYSCKMFCLIDNSFLVKIGIISHNSFPPVICQKYFKTWKLCSLFQNSFFGFRLLLLNFSLNSKKINQQMINGLFVKLHFCLVLLQSIFIFFCCFTPTAA